VRSAEEVARLVLSRWQSVDMKVFTPSLKEVQHTCLTRSPGSGYSKVKADA
jgi:hypothetical protein